MKTLTVKDSTLLYEVRIMHTLIQNTDYYNMVSKIGYKLPNEISRQCKKHYVST